MGAGVSAGAAALDFLNDWAAWLVSAGVLLAMLFGKSWGRAVGEWRDGVLAAVFRPFGAGARAERAMSEILAELRPNGGLSLRDAVTRVEERQVRFQHRMGWVLRDRADAAVTWETDAAGLCVHVSKAYETLIGRPLADLLGWGWVVAIHQDDADAVREHWRHAVEERRPFEMRFRVQHADGEVHAVLSRAAPLIVAEGRLIGWSGVWEVEG